MAGGIQGGSDRDEMPAISEINVTPFVDVVLVLLVIFMVTAPMLVREQMSVNLPKAQMGEKSASQAISIVIDKAGSVMLMEKPISLDLLGDEIKKMLVSNPNAQAVISADQDSKHGDVVKVMDLLKAAGLTRFAIQIDRK
jgi:biopolymer transport protein ExbD